MTQKHPGNSIGKYVPDGLYTGAQAAEMVGRSHDTIKRWRHEKIVTPSSEMKRGGLTVFLYNDDDIAKMRKIVDAVEHGKQAG